jgi:glycine/D-amino acid oxidase-like deaminating enzyme
MRQTADDLRPRLRLGRSIWLTDQPRQARYASLVGPLASHIVVVGGGMTGALVANAFTTAGVSTIVLEAGLVGRGSTAASSALLLQEPDLGLADLQKLYGERRSLRIWELTHDAVHQLVALLNRLRIPCDLRHRDAVYYATTADAVQRLACEFDLRRRAGFSGDWLSAGQLRRTTAIPARGAIRTRGSAQFDPYRACGGILQGAAASGARIFERSPVTRIDGGRDRVRVTTRRGTVVARRVIIATGYATPYFRPLAGRFRMYRTYVLATESIGARQRSEIGLPDVMVWDTERPYHYARWTPDHRLLLGGADRRLRAGQRGRRQVELATQELREYFDTLLPALASVDTRLAWDGLFALTPDSLPYIGPHRRYPGHWFALGYGGNGMTFGFLAARMLLERWQGVRSPDQCAV